jgi:hypothetical protein
MELVLSGGRLNEVMPHATHGIPTLIICKDKDDVRSVVTTVGVGR